jgi:hypothetical protein
MNGSGRQGANIVWFDLAFMRVECDPLWILTLAGKVSTLQRRLF